MNQPNPYPPDMHEQRVDAVVRAINDVIPARAIDADFRGNGQDDIVRFCGGNGVYLRGLAEHIVDQLEHDAWDKSESWPTQP